MDSVQVRLSIFIFWLPRFLTEKLLWWWSLLALLHFVMFLRLHRLYGCWYMQKWMSYLMRQIQVGKNRTAKIMPYYNSSNYLKCFVDLFNLNFLNIFSTRNRKQYRKQKHYLFWAFEANSLISVWSLVGYRNPVKSTPIHVCLYTSSVAKTGLCL